MLIISLAVCQGVGFVGSLFTRPAISTWYVLIEKPSFNPPNWIFVPVWSILYVLMAVAAYLVWRKGFQSPGVKKALGVFSATCA
jgi:tryptophan-rich sensory protein